MIVYLYDIKSTVKDYNKIKRRFYYHLNKNSLNQYFWKTKSVFAVPNELETTIDSFFKRFRKQVVVYKIFCESIEEL